MPRAEPHDGALVSARAFFLGTIDLRPLGVMRIAFGAAALWCTAGMAKVIEPLFSDSGVVPLDAARSGLSHPGHFSVFDAARSDGALWLLYAATVLALVAFTVGYRTRLATVASFILLSGLYERNPLAVRGASELFRVVLFWLIFTQSGAVASIDARVAASRRKPLPTIGSALPVRICQLQVAWMYLSAGLFKLASPAWREGRAVHLALGLAHSYSSALGQRLFDFELPTTAANYGVMFFELAFLPLVMWPFGTLPKVRGAMLSAGVLFHLSLLATMKLPVFSIAALSTYPIFFEPSWLSSLAIPAVPGSEQSPRMRAVQLMLIPALLFACWNGAPPQVPRPWHWVRIAVERGELWQRWNMWAPSPPTSDVSLEAQGVLTDGTEVNVLGAPAVPSDSYYWTAYLDSIAFAEDDRWLSEFARYLCRSLNLARPSGAPRLKSFELYRVSRAIPAADPPTRALLWSQHCWQ